MTKSIVILLIFVIVIEYVDLYVFKTTYMKRHNSNQIFIYKAFYMLSFALHEVGIFCGMMFCMVNSIAPIKGIRAILLCALLLVFGGFTGAIIFARGIMHIENGIIYITHLNGRKEEIKMDEIRNIEKSKNKAIITFKSGAEIKLFFPEQEENEFMKLLQ